MVQSSKKTQQRAHQVRIIGGQWKRSLLPVMTVEGLRPTTDRVRETVFNWLTHLLDGNWEQIRCLDVCAGSGALGFEAASRGASHVVCLDTHRGVIQHLNSAKQKLHADQVSIIQGDAVTTIQKAVTLNQAVFDVIFVDPPYHHDWLSQLLPLCETALSDHGYLYVEAEYALQDKQDLPWMQAWEVIRADKAGMVFYHILQRRVM